MSDNATTLNLTGYRVWWEGDGSESPPRFQSSVSGDDPRIASVSAWTDEDSRELESFMKSSIERMKRLRERMSMPTARLCAEIKQQCS